MPPYPIDEKLKRFVEKAARLRNEFLPQVFFRSDQTTGALVVPMQGQQTKYIRLSLPGPGENILHLGSIQIEADGAMLEGDDLEICRLEISSIYDGTEQLVESQAFLRQKTHVGFHTKRESCPTLVIDLGIRRSINRIVINNRDDNWAHRGWALKVESSQDGQSWATVFDLDVHHRLFAEVVSSLAANAYSVDESIHLEFSRKVLMSVFRQDYEGARKQFHQEHRVQRREKEALVEALNEQILFPQKLEWTSHGPVKSFRFWSRKEKTAYLQNAVEIAETLRDFSPDVSFGFGSVLSLVRNQDLIPHDDDLDLIVCLPFSQFKNFTTCLRELERFLQSRNLKPLGNYLSHRNVVKAGAARAVDVFVGYERSGSVSWFPGPREQILYADVFPTLRSTFLSVCCPMPRNPFAYLENVYGPNWASPQPNWNHAWDRKQYADLFCE